MYVRCHPRSRRGRVSESFDSVLGKRWPMVSPLGAAFVRRPAIRTGAGGSIARTTGAPQRASPPPWRNAGRSQSNACPSTAVPPHRHRPHLFGQRWQTALVVARPRPLDQRARRRARWPRRRRVVRRSANTPACPGSRFPTRRGPPPARTARTERLCCASTLLQQRYAPALRASPDARVDRFGYAHQKLGARLHGADGNAASPKRARQLEHKAFLLC